MDEEVSIVAVFLIERWALVFNTVGRSARRSRNSRETEYLTNPNPYLQNITDSVDQLQAQYEHGGARQDNMVSIASSSV